MSEQGRPHISRRALVAQRGECTRPIDVRRNTLSDFGREAAYRGLHTEQLVAKVLDAVAEDDLFAAVLDR